MDLLPLWAIGAVGGAAPEVLKWIALQDKLYKGIPEPAKCLAYWLVFALRVVLGGFLVELHLAIDDVSLGVFLALHIGASGPLILAPLVSHAPQLDPGSSG